MKKRILGRTNLEVTELSLGGLFISEIGGEFEKSKAAALHALDLGMNFIDTAPGYGNSEEVLGKILAGVDKPYIISTKLGGRPKPFLPKDKDCLLKSVEMSLKALGRDKIDFLMIHEPERPREYDWWNDFDKAEGPVMEVFEQLKREKVIKYIGLGGTSAYQITRIMETGKFDVVLTAFNYSLLFREAQLEIIPTAKKLGMGIIIGSPLQQGMLARRYDEVVQSAPRWLSKKRREQFLKLYKLLDEENITLPELGLRFVLSNSDISTVLTGVRSVEEVDSSVAAAEKGPLPQKLLDRLDEIYAIQPFRPFEEPVGLPFTGDYAGLGGM